MKPAGVRVFGSEGNSTWKRKGKLKAGACRDVWDT